VLTRRTAWLVAIVATLTMTVSYIDRTAPSVLSVSVMEDLHGRLVDQLDSYAVSAIALGAWAVPGGLVWLAWRPATRFVPRARVHTAG
jgi:hypothetical protein